MKVFATVVCLGVRNGYSTETVIIAVMYSALVGQASFRPLATSLVHLVVWLTVVVTPLAVGRFGWRGAKTYLI